VTSLRSNSAVVTKAAYLLYYRRRAARSRCNVNLREWIRAVCIASGPVMNPTPVYRQPDYRYDQPDGMCESVDSQSVFVLADANQSVNRAIDLL